MVAILMAILPDGDFCGGDHTNKGYMEHYKEGEIRSRQKQLVLIFIFALGLGRTIILCFMLLFYNLAI